ncbi:nitrate- and nitrite sensing domain-containing protein [Planomonospora corallina]|uniref:histidine kinase n=1 Tax=Planomonospora corallina TaxID=1806052 RepID=A0ABV8I2X8_9ACTN
MASSRSIRFKVSVLLAVPLVSLVALWGLATLTTSEEVITRLNVGTLSDGVIKPGNVLLNNLQREHLLSAEYLATGAEVDRLTLLGQRKVTDQARDRFREESATDSVRSLLTPQMTALLDRMTAHLGRFDAVRAKIDSGRIGIVELTEEFAVMPDVFQRFAVGVTIGNAVEARAVITMAYSKDFLTRQRAVAAGALAAERPLTPEETRLFSRFADMHAFLMKQGLADLSTEELRAPFAKVAASQAHDRFMAMEEQLLSGMTVPYDDWRTVTDRLDAEFQVQIGTANAFMIDRARGKAVPIFVRAGIAGGIGLIAVIVSLVLSYRVGRGLTRELAGLRQAAADMAEVRLPRVMERLRRGQEVDVAAEAPPLEPLGTTTEVHAVAAAFDSVRYRALDAAVEQARLREGVAHAFRNLARRKQSLLQRQLKLLDGMQKEAEDPGTLEKLFALDHLTTRMRRHAEGLVILSGGAAGRKWRSAVPMEDVLRGAAAQVEDYARVRIYPMPAGTLSGGAVADMMHLFAELIENATAFSPPGGEVSVRGSRAARGFAVEVEDRGLGLDKEKREAINERLASPPEFDPVETDRLGFAVVGLLAARYGVGVTLRPSPYGGTTVVVLIPENLLGGTGKPPAAEPAVSPVPERTPAPAAAGGQAAGGPTDIGHAQPAGPATAVPARAHAVAGAPGAAQRRSGLPRRVRQANLTPQLLQGEPEAAAPAEAKVSETVSGTEERSPEEARALLSSLQSGWRRGRSESEDNGGEGA